MRLFKIKAESSQSIFDQVVFAATKSILAGEFQPGDPFPSISKIASDLKIHPNTAHKVIQYLIREKWLISMPGKGTVVARVPKSSNEDRQKLLNDEIEQLVVRAKRVGLGLGSVIESLESHWKEFENLKDVSNDN